MTCTAKFYIRFDHHLLHLEPRLFKEIPIEAKSVHHAKALVTQFIKANERLLRWHVLDSGARWQTLVAEKGYWHVRRTFRHAPPEESDILSDYIFVDLFIKSE